MEFALARDVGKRSHDATYRAAAVLARRYGSHAQDIVAGLAGANLDFTLHGGALHGEPAQQVVIAETEPVEQLLAGKAARRGL